VDGNIVDLKLDKKDRVLDSLKSLGYTTCDFRRIEWIYEMNSGTLFIEYWGGKLRIKERRLDKIGAGKIFHVEKLTIDEVDFTNVPKEKQPRIVPMDDLCIFEGDCNNLFKLI